MELLLDYILFFIKVFTIAIAIILVATGILAAATKQKLKTLSGKIKIKNLNKKYQKQKDALRHEVLTKKELKAILKQEKKTESTAKNNLFVIDFHGDIKASEVHNLSEQINALLLIATPKDEILIKLESPGGMVPGYGLGAAQLARFKAKNIKVTICVDKIAASGGYLMACTADKIIAAPFAIVGSIGVIGQLPNFHNLLKKHNIEFEQHTAGEYKRNLTLFGKNTGSDRKKFQEDLEITQSLFKKFVHTYRPQLNINEVATGDHWYGEDALKLKLVDEISTSDDFILSNLTKLNIYQISLPKKKNFLQKITQSAANILQNINYT